MCFTDPKELEAALELVRRNNDDPDSVDFLKQSVFRCLTPHQQRRKIGHPIQYLRKYSARLPDCDYRSLVEEGAKQIYKRHATCGAQKTSGGARIEKRGDDW